MLLSVQLFDSLKPGYKRMLSRQLQQMQPLIAVFLYNIVAKPMQKHHADRPERMDLRGKGDFSWPGS